MNVTSVSSPKEEFSFDRKQRLATRISDMRDKITLKKIKDIIFANNPGITARKSDGGYLMYFQNYTNDTYFKIEKLLNKIENDKLEKQTKIITETNYFPKGETSGSATGKLTGISSEQMLLSSDDPTSDYNMSRSRLRYSNREKRLIRRCQYEDIINEPVSDTFKTISSEKNNNDNISVESSNNSSDIDSDVDNNVIANNNVRNSILPSRNTNTKTTLIKANKLKIKSKNIQHNKNESNSEANDETNDNSNDSSNDSPNDSSNDSSNNESKDEQNNISKSKIKPNGKTKSNIKPAPKATKSSKLVKTTKTTKSTPLKTPKSTTFKASKTTVAKSTTKSTIKPTAKSTTKSTSKLTSTSKKTPSIFQKSNQRGAKN